MCCQGSCTLLTSHRIINTTWSLGPVTSSNPNYFPQSPHAKCCQQISALNLHKLQKDTFKSQKNQHLESFRKCLQTTFLPDNRPVGQSQSGNFRALLTPEQDGPGATTCPGRPNSSTPSARSSQKQPGIPHAGSTATPPFQHI